MKDLMVLLILSFLVLGYSLAPVSFAKIHLYIVNVPFPLFIGEACLIAAGALSIPRIFPNFRRPNAAVIYVCLYGLWLALKIAFGYAHGQGFALRNAALFYYPFTALFVYHACRGQCPAKYKAHNEKFLLAAAALFGILALTVSMGPFARYYIVAFLAITVWLLRGTKWHWPLLALAVVALFRSGILYCVSRSHVIGVIGAFIFLLLYFITFINFSVRQKAAMAVVSMAALVALVVFVSDQNAIKSMISPKEVMGVYDKFQKEIDAKRSSYVPENLAVCVYHREYCYARGVLQEKHYEDGAPVPVSLPVEARAVAVPPVPEARHDMADAHPPAPEKNAAVPAHIREIEPGMSENEVKVALVVPNADINGGGAPSGLGSSITTGPPQERPLGTAYVNILFRYFIWKDMWEEFFTQKPFITGFGFDRPQRSKSLEMLNWGPWREDGWITPHNSFFHWIYRGGIVGLLIVVLMVASLVKMTGVFRKARSVIGGILLSILVFGAVSANFLVFFELPYTAIPFWFIWGITMAYARQLRERS